MVTGGHAILTTVGDEDTGTQGRERQEAVGGAGCVVRRAGGLRERGDLSVHGSCLDCEKKYITSLK